MLCVYTFSVAASLIHKIWSPIRMCPSSFLLIFGQPALGGFVFSEARQSVHVCVGMGVREKTQTPGRHYSLCAWCLGRCSILGCKNILVHSAEWGPVRFSAAAAGLMAEELFQVCLSFLLLSFHLRVHATAETTFVATGKATSSPGSR